MTLLEQQYAFRDEMVARLERDLVGPWGGEDEVLEDPPITRYVSGVLYPDAMGVRVDSADDVDESDADGEAADNGSAYDPAVSFTNVRHPSSMGCTFAVEAWVGDIVVRMGAARYAPVEVAEADNGAYESSTRAGIRGRRSRFRARTTVEWVRRPFTAEVVRIGVGTPSRGTRIAVGEGLDLFYRIRPADSAGHVAVTLILINTLTLPQPNARRDEFSWLQPFIEVATDGRHAIVNRPGPELPTWDEDLRSYGLLYRHCTSMGIGHGCSLTWEQNPGDPTHVDSVRTTFVPRYELLLADSNAEIPTDALVMRSIARGSRDLTLAGLGALCDGYEEWIETQRAEASQLDPGLQAVAAGQLEDCTGALGRMRRGVELLGSDPTVWSAFKLMNEAMLVQRARTEWLGSRGEGEPVAGENHRWRPFQIAFILLCLEGIVHPDSDDRELADLLWFPTGGGKTEAYLGLLAFTILLRRMRDRDHGHGVTVLMRYTLRLLTIQQFERAAMLICSLESLRRKHDELGREPISIGLWFGRAATPNSLDEARRSIDKLRKGVVPSEGNPLQLQSCPWCGTRLNTRSVYIGENPRRLVTACRNEGCEFGKGLPLWVVDDDVYDRHPTLVIATVDKFASLPWRDKAWSLFNLDLPGVAPPELIIQDELHLISGPLGTLVGLYESAIDMLCTAEGRRPKVIASTATIRRAGEQTKGLFDREVRQFPPPATDARDSYFSVEASRDERGTRMYLGCMAPGISQTTLMVRTYAALLQGAADLDAPSAVKDPYWTLVGYFNSLRVLGGARMQVQDDVTDRMELLANLTGGTVRDTDERIELTSREPSGDIPDHLQRMSRTLPDNPLDVILATNMISVGVDIDRLGLMAVMGQPQSTSEYIQATSRVGRRHPGLVVVLFNASKSRDRSHYESFHDFHGALYRQVEASSVTPFSARSRDRGLHAVLVTLTRLSVPGMRDNSSAAEIARVESQVRAIAAELVRRVRKVDEQEADRTADELDEILADWILRAEDQHDLVYSNPNHPDLALLGDAASPEDDLQGAMPTLWSLRDVDQTSNLHQVG